MMTAIFSMLLGALGIGQALMDMGDQVAGAKAAANIFAEIDQGNSMYRKNVFTFLED
jgi:hypothetical protein